jgi:hypothetical protein
MKKIINLFLFLVILSSIGLALNDFTVSIVPIKDKIFWNETAKFKVYVANNLANEQAFIVYPEDVTWDLDIVPAEDRHKNIPGKQRDYIVIELKPLQQLWPNLYGVPIKVKNLESGEVIRKDIVIEIKGETSELEGMYLPSVRGWFSVPKSVDPRKSFDVILHLKNQNPLNLSSINVILKSNLIQKTYETSLEGLEKKDLRLSQRLDKLTKPQDDLMNIIIRVHQYDQDYEFRTESRPFKIIEYGKVDIKEITNNSFLKSTKNILIKNTGNKEKSFKYVFRKNKFNEIFMDYSIKPSQKELNGFIWEGILDPESQLRIEITINYRPIFYVLLAFLFLLASYYIFRSPFIIKKNIKVLGRKDGGLSELRIQIFVKNRTRRRFYEIELKDKVPNLLEVQHPFEIGTLYPSNVLKSDKKGTLIKWQLDELEPFEERIFTYKVKAKLVILGDLLLPPSIMKYKSHYSKPHKSAYSNEVNFKNE